MANYTTCNKCLSVETESETVHSAADGSMNRTTCCNCGASAVWPTGRTIDSTGVFAGLEDTEIVDRRNRVQDLTGSKPWN